MHVTFENPGPEAMISSMLAFQGENEFWSGPLFYFYPELEEARCLPASARQAFMETALRRAYDLSAEEIGTKVLLYAAHWDFCRPQITAALSDAFGVDCGSIFNDLVCHVTLNPIQPRYLQERQYETFWRNSPAGAIGSGIHEMIHFVWFHVWQQEFGEENSDYERPSLPWLLSEMVVEPIMRDERLSSINPYFPREQGGCVYPCFYEMRVEDELVLETLYRMLRTMPMRDFMRTAWAWCVANEQAIRMQAESVL